MGEKTLLTLCEGMGLPPVAQPEAVAEALVTREPLRLE